MPFNITQTYGRMPHTTGNGQVAQRPDPNQGMVSQYVANGFGGGGANPDKSGAGSSMNYYQDQFNQRVAQAHNPNGFQSNMLPNATGWGPYLQRLQENHVGKLGTTAGMASVAQRALFNQGQKPMDKGYEQGSSMASAGKPGFFDQQNHSALEQLQRLQYLQASDLNTYGRSF